MAQDLAATGYRQYVIWHRATWPCRPVNDQEPSRRPKNSCGSRDLAFFSSPTRSGAERDVGHRARTVRTSTNRKPAGAGGIASMTVRWPLSVSRQFWPRHRSCCSTARRHPPLDGLAVRVRCRALPEGSNLVGFMQAQLEPLPIQQSPPMASCARPTPARSGSSAGDRCSRQRRNRARERRYQPR